MKVFLKCEEANHTCDKTQYKEASLWEKIKLNIHLIYCSACRKYTARNTKLTQLLTSRNLKLLEQSKKKKWKKPFKEKFQNKFDNNNNTPNQTMGIPSIQNEAKYLNCFLIVSQLRPLQLETKLSINSKNILFENSSLNPSIIRQINSKNNPNTFTLLIPNCCGSVLKRWNASNCRSLISKGIVRTMTIKNR